MAFRRKGVRALKLAAEKGDPDAQLEYGRRYLLGEGGVEEDHTKAAPWFKKAAEQGGVGAYIYLAYFYRDGVGVDKDLAQASLWFQKAADLGDAEAQYKLGMMYRFGTGVETDFLRAAACFEQAAEQGNAEAQLMLGSFYIIGMGVDMDLELAGRWITKAAEQGLAEAQYWMGRAFEKSGDRLQSLVWYCKAARQEHTEARHAIDRRCGYGEAAANRDV